MNDVQPAASSSSPEDVGVAAVGVAAVGVAAVGVAVVGVAVAGVSAFSSVLHLFTLPKVILAFSTWNRGISARERNRYDAQKQVTVLFST